MILFRRRKVRLHQLDPGPTIEGFLIRNPWRSAGNYVLKQAGVVQAPDQTIALDGSREQWVPRERVVLVEVL